MRDRVAQARNEGLRGTIPRVPKSPNKVTSTFFNTVHLLPKDLRFEHGGAKLDVCPVRHLTSLRRWCCRSRKYRLAVDLITGT